MLRETFTTSSNSLLRLFLGGFSSRKNSTITTVAWAQGAGLVVVLIAAPFIGAFKVELADILWGMAGGVSGALGVLFLFRGFSTGIASIVSPVAALCGAALPVLFDFLTRERPPLSTWLGVAMLLPAILLLSWERGEKNDHVLTIYTAGTHIRSLVRRVTLLSGILDMAANVFYLLAARTGYLIIAVNLSALYPAPTVVFQKIFLREKLTTLRIAGLMLSIAGAALIGVGG